VATERVDSSGLSAPRFQQYRKERGGEGGGGEGKAGLARVSKHCFAFRLVAKGGREGGGAHSLSSSPCIAALLCLSALNDN
jgi:hypothetical protein